MVQKKHKVILNIFFLRELVKRIYVTFADSYPEWTCVKENGVTEATPNLEKTNKNCFMNHVHESVGSLYRKVFLKYATEAAASASSSSMLAP